ncbi:MAG: YwaF family protein [Defluviitaleaceae bacterium]|nr:YwaF family protein [Defluviitaleaceae bacterium]
MNYFFGFLPTVEQGIEFFYNINHLVFLFLMLGAFAALYFGLNSTNDKKTRRSMLVLGLCFYALEAGRIAWIAGENAHAGYAFDFGFWIGIIPFSYCGTMSLASGTILIISAFKKNCQTFTMQIFYNILFGLGMLGGLITFSAPGIFDERFSFMHFRNVQTITVHLLLIFAPIYLIKTGRMKIRLRNIWMAMCGFLGTASVMMAASQLSGVNRGWALYVDEMVEFANIYIPFPWHLPVIFLGLFVIPTKFYIAAEIRYRKKRKNINDINPYAVHIPTVMSGLLLTTAGIVLIPLAFQESPIMNWWALLCLVPLCVLIGSVVAARFIGKN